ncbi:MAG: LysM peptidoglycan-binding domain-containing protein [Mobilitalea sp.]
MIIHVVQAGETIDTIAQKYEKSVESIIQDNELANPNNLAIGQAIVIVYPKEVYTIQQGDTLEGIANTYNVSVMQLLRNNPYLADREYIYPGETIVISYDAPKADITTNGYAFPYINKSILRKTLPFLTYLSIFSYSISAEGELNTIDDTELINIAKAYGVAPIMVISNITETGAANIDILHSLLNDPERVNLLTDNVLNILKSKGYYGVNIDIPYIPPEDTQVFNDIISQISDRLHSENFKIFITITPITFEIYSETSHQVPDFTAIGQKVDGVNLLSYSWGRAYDVPIEIIPFYVFRFLLNLNNKLGILGKTTIGISTIGYIAEIPVVEGVSSAISITDTNAVILASDSGSTIYYNQINQTSYFYIFSYDKNYFIYFNDARGIDARTQLVPEYDLNGITIWNIMNFFAQMYLVINTQYSIIKVL